MKDISLLLNQFVENLCEIFGDRVFFIGLQGSYARGEATETSDIDFVVVLDKLSLSDIKKYNSMLDTLPDRELLCGFISGKEELLNWEPSDLFQLYYDTKPIKGSIDVLLTLIDAEAANRAIKTGTCNIYHGCVHNMLYEKSDEIIKGLYKSASFVIQAIYFRENGKYITSKKDMLPLLSDIDKTILENSIRLKNGDTVAFDRMSADLFEWSEYHINKSS